MSLLLNRKLNFWLSKDDEHSAAVWKVQKTAAATAAVQFPHPLCRHNVEMADGSTNSSRAIWTQPYRSRPCIRGRQTVVLLGCSIISAADRYLYVAWWTNTNTRRA